MAIQKQSVLHVAKGEKQRFPLRLDIQFFADPPEEKKKEESDDDDELLTLKDMFKKYPHLRVEHKTKITDAVTERFKQYDFDPEEAKKALAEKKAREESGDTTEAVKNQLNNEFKSKEDKYLARIKNLAVENYAARDGLDSKLISKLAADQVSKLSLGDDLTLKSDDLDEILDELRTEFPTVFPVKDENLDPKDKDVVIPPVNKKFVPGSSQKTNQPPAGGEDVKDEMASILQNINRRNGIKPKE